MSLTEKKIYELLPAIYRIRDIEQGEPLKALFGVIAREAGVVENDIDQLYENWFIETCDEWMIPYIGDLLGVRGLHSIDSVPDFSIRAYVANTLRYRRRKGTAPVLEQLALDTTGWRARVVEFFDLLGTTQNINHIRLHNIVTPDLRCMNKLELLNTAFDTIPHTVDVRSIEKENGWYNIPNIGLFLWRLQSYRMSKSTARKVNPGPNEGFTFSPLGFDMHVFNRPQTEMEITHLAEEHNVPGLLRRLPLYLELEELRQGIANGKSKTSLIRQGEWFNLKPVLQVMSDGFEIEPKEILICNLQQWTKPDDHKPYEDSSGVDIDIPISVAVDPVLGRITFPTSTTPEKV
ncbi:MAG: phage tail protein, partial [Bacteroidales bacterium]|nr:phage tail protein [Bacteroidales bacterium]